MKIGDKVYITCNDRRIWKSDKNCTISKIGNKYFEVEEVGPWYKFSIDPNNKEFKNRSIDAKGASRGKPSGSFEWYPSEEYYLEKQENISRRYFVKENISLLTDEEILGLYQKIKGRGGK